MDTFEFRAHFPGDSHDTWVQGGFTPWESERKLLDRLASRARLIGLENVKVYKRQVFPAADVTNEFITLTIKSPS